MDESTSTPREGARLQELRRRVAADPASTVFAQLAEEYLRLGNADAAVDCCRAGLVTHPTYLSARVILGRALSALGQLDEATEAFETVLRGAPDNLAALKGLAEVDRRLGRTVERPPAPIAAVRAAMAAAAPSHLQRESEPVPAPVLDPLSGVHPVSDSAGEAGTGVARVRAAVPEPPMEPVAPAPLAPPSPPEPVDFDAILTKLGVPGLAPPPQTAAIIDALLPPAAAEKEPVTRPVSPGESTAAEHSTAADAVTAGATARDMPGCDTATTDTATADTVTTETATTETAATEIGGVPELDRAILAELEAWLSAIQSDRDATRA